MNLRCRMGLHNFSKPVGRIAQALGILNPGGEIDYQYSFHWLWECSRCGKRTWGKSPEGELFWKRVDNVPSVDGICRRCKKLHPSWMTCVYPSLEPENRSECEDWESSINI